MLSSAKFKQKYERMDFRSQAFKDCLLDFFGPNHELVTRFDPETSEPNKYTYGVLQMYSVYMQQDPMILLTKMGAMLQIIVTISEWRLEKVSEPLVDEASVFRANTTAKLDNIEKMLTSLYNHINYAPPIAEQMDQQNDPFGGKMQLGNLIPEPTGFKEHTNFRKKRERSNSANS